MKRNILIVEDEEILATVLEKNVTKLGHQVAGKVESGEEAIPVVKEGNCDLIIMDINLAGNLTGIETMQEIRKFSKIPVIYLAGSFDPTLNIKASTTNPISYLVKPVDMELLQESINKA